MGKIKDTQTRLQDMKEYENSERKSSDRDDMQRHGRGGESVCKPE